MKNVINEEPTPPDKLHGRLLHSTHIVDDVDLKGKRVLDIGCGYGWFELYALSKGVHRVIGIEPSRSDLRTSSRHVRNDAVGLAAGSAIALPFEDRTFDTVVCWEVLEHIPKGTEQRYFAEVRRVLRPGGTLYLSTPMRSIPSTCLDPAFWLIAHRHYSPERVRAFAENAGLSVVVLQPGGRWLEILSWWNLYIMKWVFRRRPLLTRFLNPRLDVEFSRQDGFTNMFCMLRAA